jgi:hypothetical protein
LESITTELDGSSPIETEVNQLAIMIHANATKVSLMKKFFMVWIRLKTIKQDFLL